MKKWMFMLGSFVIGVVVATSGSAFADQVKSLVGQKVTGEYKVIVNGKALEGKGAVINGTANAPVRALSDALGADLKVDGKTIFIATSETSTPSIADDQVSNGSSSAANKYVGGTKDSLLLAKDNYENKILKLGIEGRDNILAEIKGLKELEAKGIPVPVLDEKEKQLQQYEAIISENQKELELINEALAALEK